MKSNQPLFFQASFPKNSSILVFIDSQVQDFQDLKNGIKAGAEIYILHPEVDGVEQITQTLSQHQDVESIHIISHGTPGTLYLGNAELSLKTLGHYTQELQTWLNSTPDYYTPALLLYSCNVGADGGTEFLEKLHNITQANIYASSTAVGNSNLGSNWDLDVRYGKDISHFPGLIFQPEVLVTYAGVFGTGGDKYYTYYDSKEGTKGTVPFIDISSTGIFQSIVGRDQQTSITLPFEFNFYGNNFSQIIIGENGGISFNGTAQFRNNAIIPSTSSGVPVNSIFPFWDDLDAQITATDRTGKIYTKSESNRFTVQWTNFKAENNNNNNITFQVVLYKDSNNIDFIYSTATQNDGSTASIGLNKGTLEDSKAVGVAYSVNASNLNGVSSIRFVTEPQLKVNTLAVKEGETITLSSSNFNATDVDNSIDLSKITYIISNLQNGEFRLNGIPKTTFTQQDINSGVVQFVHNSSENAPSFNIILSDGYNTSSQKTPTISFTNINNNPELKDIIYSVTFNENALNIAASIIYSNITLTDIDSSDFNAGNLTVNYSSGSGAEDQLSVNSGSNGITLSSGNVSYNGTVFGSIDTINNGAGGKGLVIRFTNVNATLAAVKALIQNLTYQNTSNTPNPSRTISITVNDGDGGTSTAVSKVINVIAENDAPVNTVLATQTINEDQILTFTADSLISISDPDAGNNPIKVRLETNKGTLSLNGISGLDFTGGIGDGTDNATLQFKGIITDINKALNGMKFKPTANSNGTALVRVLTDDLGNSGAGTNLTSDKTITININAINDAPVNTVPAAQSVKEENILVFNSANNNLIRVDDVDVNENPTGVLQVTLSVTKGILTLASINGINFDSGNSNAQANITFTGKLADVNNALNGLTYLGNTNLNGTDTLKIITDDLGNVGIGGSKKDEKLISINIDAVNDAPINTVPGAQSVEEDKDLIFSMANGKAITVSDVDVNEGTGELEVTLSVTNGALILADTTGISFLSGSSNGKSSIFFKGTLSAINKALDGLTYRGNLNYNGTDILSIVTSDLGNKGEGGVLEDASKTVQINVTAVNDAPVNTFPGQQSIEEDKNLVFKSSTSNAISVSDVDLAKDKGDIQVILSVIKGKLTLGQQTTGLTLLQGNESNSITLKGTQTDINSALEGLTYRGNQDFNGDDTLKILTSDLGNTGIPGELKKEDTVQIKVIAINDAPEIAVPVSQVINEDTDLELTGINAIQVKDVDAAEGSGEVQVKLSVAKGTLNLKVITGLTFDATSGNGKSDVIFRGKIADVNIALKSLFYRGNLNVNGDDTLTVTASDLGNTGIGGILTDTKRVQITINPVNDSPINTVPIQQIVDEDVQLIFNTANGNAISITDVDALEGTGKVEVKLSVAKGLLTLSNTSDLTFTEGDGVSDSNLTFTGSVDKINQALNGLVYIGNQDSNSNAKGDDTLTIITSDLGNTGDGGIKTDTDTVTIKRNAINDAPVNTVPGNQSVDEDTDLALTGAKAIQIKDVDAAEGTGVVEVKLSVGKGILTLQNTANLTFNSNNTNGKSTVVFRGQIADINAALNTLVYRGNLNANGVDTLTVTTNDLGNTGRGGALTDIDSFQITIDPVNDTPLIAVPMEQNVNEDFTLVFNDFNKNAITISDVDVKEGTGILEVTLSVTHGLLTLSSTTGLEFINGDGLGNATMTFRGSIDRVNQVLNGLTYLGNKDLNSDVQGEDNLTISTSDLGNRGKGNILKDEETVKIQLTAINDAPINTVPGEQTVKEDTDLTFSTINKNAITVSDIDVNEGTGDLKVTVGVTKGALTLKQITGLTFLQGDGTINTSMTFKGKVIDINSALEGLVYRGNQDFNGEDTLTINTNDLGNSGSGGPLTKQDIVKIKVSAVNDAPIIIFSNFKNLSQKAAFDGKQVKLSLSLQREAANNNSAYLYRVDDAKGSIRDPLTGMLLDPTSSLSVEQKQRYLELITTDRLVQGTEIQAANLQTQEISVNLIGGGYYLPFLVSNGTLSSINKDLSRILTSHLGINSDGVEHIRSLGNNKFGF
ncbi:DUF4347 domain-containing protein [uncultured Nostoc sp.]|uniref:DUF4347 domain-containing protein n=1 Tax=uncultured Nostoc sp. TaxID=340711 RepID=UPI0035C9ECF7